MRQHVAPSCAQAANVAYVMFQERWPLADQSLRVVCVSAAPKIDWPRTPTARWLSEECCAALGGAPAALHAGYRSDGRVH